MILGAAACSAIELAQINLCGIIRETRRTRRCARAEHPNHEHRCLPSAAAGASRGESTRLRRLRRCKRPSIDGHVHSSDSLRPSCPTAAPQPTNRPLLLFEWATMAGAQRATTGQAIVSPLSKFRRHKKCPRGRRKSLRGAWWSCTSCSPAFWTASDKSCSRSPTRSCIRAPLSQLLVRPVCDSFYSRFAGSWFRLVESKLGASCLSHERARCHRRAVVRPRNVLVRALQSPVPPVNIAAHSLQGTSSGICQTAAILPAPCLPICGPSQDA